VTAFICETCGTQFRDTETPPTGCPICLDERQYVGYGGQTWTTLESLGRTHRTRVAEAEPGLVGIGMEPRFAIGQRALLVGGLLWDCIPLVDDDAARAVEAAGGVHTIAISHPHYYGSMVEWAERFDARVLLHEADRAHIMRPSDRIERWSGERYAVDDDLELIRLGGHFAGGTVCLWRRGAGACGVLLSGDIVQVVADRDRVSFMYSYPNLIPLPASDVTRIRSVLETLAFDRIYGAWWDSAVSHHARAKALRSADRYLNALAGKLPTEGGEAAEISSAYLP
jgi:hypothetical protein